MKTEVYQNLRLLYATSNLLLIKTRQIPCLRGYLKIQFMVIQKMSWQTTHTQYRLIIRTRDLQQITSLTTKSMALETAMRMKCLVMLMLLHHCVWGLTCGRRRIGILTLEVKHDIHGKSRMWMSIILFLITEYSSTLTILQLCGIHNLSHIRILT